MKGREMEGCHPVRMLGRARTAALNLLRAIGSPTSECATEPSSRSLHTLLARWRARGFALSEPGSGYTSPDEYLLLAALACAQNRAPVLPLDVELGRRLGAGARALGRMQIHLPLSRPMLKLLEEKGWIAPLAQELPHRQARTGFDKVPRTRSGTLRQRAVTFAAGKPSVTTAEFRAIGVSRQYLRTISAAGYLERVGYGRYRVPPVSGSGGEDKRNGHLPAHHD